MKYFVKPWAHQLEGIEICRNRPFFGLFFDPGTGKTATAINVCRHYYAAEKRILKTLILCPISVVEAWRREFAEHSSEMTMAAVQCLTGSRTNRLKQLKTRHKWIFITNIDAVNTKFWEDIKRAGPWEMLILDESHRFKNHGAARTQKMIDFSDTVGKKYLLTGSPIIKDAMDIWAQFRIMSRRIFSPNFYSFRSEFFEDKNAGMPSDIHFPNWQPKPQSYARLQQIISEHSMRVDKETAIDLPPLVKQIRYAELTPEQRKHYVEMEEEFVTYINNKACTAEIALTKILRLQQIVAGILKTESGQILRVKTQKIDILKELLEDIAPNHKVIVWTNFVDTYSDIEQLCKNLNLPYRMIIGGQNSKERQEAIDSFNTDSTIRVCIANQGAGGIGIGLQAASYAIYYSKTFNLEHDIQSIARSRRGGSEIHEKITRIDIITRGTTDEPITAALHSKQKLADFLLGVKNFRNRALAA